MKKYPFTKTEMLRMCKNFLEHSDIVVITDRDDETIRYANAATLQKLGYEAGDLVGTPVGNIFYDPTERSRKLLPELRKSGSVTNYFAVLRTKSGERVYTLASTKRMPGGGTIGIGKDVTAEVNSDLEKLTMTFHFLELKNQYLRGHSRRVRDYSMLIAEKMKLADNRQMEIERGAPLHDFGKTQVTDNVLNSTKRFKTRLDAQLQRHPEYGDEILKGYSFYTEDMRAIVRWHHERMDGTGYPDHLLGGQIPTIARIVSVADAYDAMTTDRPYRKARSSKLAKDEIRRCCGIQFDFQTAYAFLQVPESKIREIRKRNF